MLERLSPLTPVSPPTPARTLWQRRVRDPIIAQLTQGITPEKLALTIAVGSCIAMFPLIGTTTLLCFLAAVVLRLNQPIIQLLNQALWPVHVPAIYGCIRLGEWMFNAPHVSFKIHDMHGLSWETTMQFWHKFGLTAAYAIAAWAILTPFLLVILYFPLLWIFRRIKKLRTETTLPPVQP